MGGSAESRRGELVEEGNYTPVSLDETGKIVSRRKGFTTTVCITAADVSPQVAGPEALEEFGETTCVEVVGQDFERTCDKACSRGCEEQIRKYLNRIEQETG